LLALYFIHQRGIKGAVVEMFKKKYLKSMKQKIQNHFFDKYTNLHTTQTVPDILKNKVLRIYSEELNEMRRHLTPFL
ncbi:MAG: hypothetical protein AAB874_03815, partial [Patescibacteria group bacterium]